MKVIKKPLTELRRPDRNVRMHTDKQLKEFRRSVEMFGQIRPIVVDEDGVISARPVSAASWSTARPPFDTDTEVFYYGNMERRHHQRRQQPAQ